MAQVVATRSIQGSMLSPNGGSVSTRSDKLLKPASFAVKVLGNESKKGGRVSVRGGRKVDTTVSVRSARVETEVIPVSPEDVPNVCVKALDKKAFPCFYRSELFFFYFFFLLLCG